MKELFYDIEKHLLEDEKPSLYMNYLLEAGKLDDYPFNMLKHLVDTPQEPKHHPEGSVWNHVMMVVDNGAKYRHLSTDKREFMWALLLHDIGKKPTTKLRKGRITSYDHDSIGAEMVSEFLNFFKLEEGFVLKVSRLVRWHMQALFVINKLPFANIKQMVEEVPINEIGLITICDRLGRGEMTKEKAEDSKEHVNEFLKVLAKESSTEPIELPLLI